MNAERPGRPTVAGSGFFGLDVVCTGSSEDPDRLMAGGTAANVLSVLAYLGWQSVPYGRIGEDRAGDLVVSDLKHWGVQVDKLVQSANVATPVVVHRVFEAGTASARHRFEWKCPRCGAYLPRYRPIPVKLALDLIPQAGLPDVFFFDRASPGPLALARVFRDAGALIVFEPSSTRGKFRESVEVAHLVKCSVERLQPEDLPGPSTNALQVLTKGERGLQYRTGDLPNWRYLTPPEPRTVIDTAGAGDWCSAGIIHALNTLGVRPGEALDEHAVSALECGQILAAFAVQATGARGAMYDIPRARLQSVVTKVLQNLAPKRVVPQGTRDVYDNLDHHDFCAHCEGALVQE